MNPLTATSRPAPRFNPENTKAPHYRGQELHPVQPRTLNFFFFPPHSREVLAFEYLKQVSQRFESSPDLGAALVLHVELLLQRGKELLGKQKIEDIITGTSTFQIKRGLNGMLHNGFAFVQAKPFLLFFLSVVIFTPTQAITQGGSCLHRPSHACTSYYGIKPADTLR